MNKKRVTKRGVLSSLMVQAGIITVALGAVVAGVAAEAKTNNSAFVVKGNVVSVDYKANSVTVNATSGTGNTTGLIGQDIIYTVKNAKFYKMNGEKKERTTFTKAVLVGNEIVMHGVKKSGSSYTVSSVTASEKSFKIIGKITKNDLTNKEITVEQIKQSSYKSKQYIGKTVHIKYGNSTKFTSMGKERNADEVPGGSQQVKVYGNVENGVWNATQVWDSYSSNKL